MIHAVLGIDTSCYTTSVAICGVEHGVADGSFFQVRRLLEVPQGKRGLMQSEAVFQHVTALPALLERLVRTHPGVKLEAVCASTRPRPQEDSYMPVFRVGESVARALALGLEIPFLRTSHQEGHLRAARIGSGLDGDTPCLALHLSGGTTELLYVEQDRLELLGGTLDLHAGQFIDRVGVAMGLAFPAGPALERLAAQGRASSRLPVSIRALDCHFSGAEAQATRWIQTAGLSREDIAAEVFSCVARTVARLVLAGCETRGAREVLLGGGVASSMLIREEVAGRVAKRNQKIRLHFARPHLSGDNAVGVALIGVKKLKEEGRCQHS